MAKKENPYKPKEVLYFRKPRKNDLCRIELYADGSALVTGCETAAGIYESAENSLELAVQAVEKLGYSRIPSPY